MLSLCPITVFSAAAAVLFLDSVTWPLSALLLPLLVKPFHALIPDVLSKGMNHTCTSESLLTNETYAPNSAVLLIEARSYNLPVDRNGTTVLRNSSKDPREGEGSVSQTSKESYLWDFLTTMPHQHQL